MGLHHMAFPGSEEKYLRRQKARSQIPWHRVLQLSTGSDKKEQNAVITFIVLFSLLPFPQASLHFSLLSTKPTKNSNMLKINYLSQYRKKAEAGKESKLVFVFKISGDKKELAEYKKIKGTNYKENEDKQPIFFTTRFPGQSADLRKNADATDYVADTSRMDQIISLTEQGVPLELAERMVATPAPVAAAPAPAGD